MARITTKMFYKITVDLIKLFEECLFLSFINKNYYRANLSISSLQKSWLIYS